MPVYFARVGDAVKIGWAVDVERRVALLQCGHPEPMAVVRVVDGDRGLEAAFHRHFHPLRIRGEWFRWTEDMATVELAIAAPPQPPAPPDHHLSALQYLTSRMGGDIPVAGKLGVSRQVLSSWRRRGISARNRAQVWMLVNDNGGNLPREWLFPTRREDAAA